jgi:hypothetical protein
MDRALEQTVRQRARNLCEYCSLDESFSSLRHVIDHIIARQHGGATVEGNLALCCGRCNLYKGPNVAGFDPGTGQLTRLFNPRADVWAEHFRWESVMLLGITAIGRTTVQVLNINQPSRVAARRTLIDVGRFPPPASA